MNTSIRTKHKLVFVSVILLLTTVACDAEESVTIEIVGNTRPEVRVIKIEVIPQNNCGGTAEVENEIEKSRSIAHTIELGEELEVNANGQIGFAGTDAELGATVASQFGYSYGSVENISRSITVKAKEGTYVEHQVKLQEVWEVGTAKVVVNGQKLEVPFSFRTDFAVELVNSKEIKNKCLTPTPTGTPKLMEPTPTPTNTPEPTTPPPPTPTPTPNGLHYDTFDDDCINKGLWGMFVDGQAGTRFLPTPVGQCWDVGQQGLSERNGRIDFERTNEAPDNVQSLLLAEQPGRTFTAVELDLNLESLSGQWGGVGLFTRLNDANRSWAYYWLRFGGNVPNNQGRVVYNEHETIKNEGDPIFSPATTVTLELRWDGQTMSFYANGSQILQPVPFSGFSDTFGIYWVTGPNSSLICHVDDFRIAWE